MKLPISLLVLAALSHALSVQPLTKRSEAKKLDTKNSPSKSPVAKSSPSKSSVAKQKDSNQTSKRELYEGNFGERNKELSSKYEVTGPPPKIVYANELQEMVSEQSPTHQIFGMRLPQIIKISDVLSEQDGGSFEAAVAKHLYSPISAYQTRVASPTSFEVPVPAASQSAYSNPKSYKVQKTSEKEQKLQEAPNVVELSNPNNIPLYTVNQPRLRFEAYPQALDQGLPQEVFQPQLIPRKHMPSLFPIYDQLGPFRYTGQVVPSEYLHQNGIYQIVPVRPDLNFGNHQGNHDKKYQGQENHEQLNAERSKPQINVPVPKQGYHAHPNGAISFASFSQNLPVNKQYETAQLQQSGSLHQSQQAHLQSQPMPVQLPAQIESKAVLQSQDQNTQINQNIPILPMFHRLLQDLEKYQPVFQQQPHLIPFKQQNQPRPLNALQQHLLYQDPRQLPNHQIIQLQRIPAFKPLPQSLLTSESFLQQTSRSPVVSGQPPRPFSFEYQSTSPPENFDLAVKPASTQLTPLPPLKPNYSKYVKPLEPHSHTTPVFLPTPLQPLPSTPKGEPIFDQLISSTTVQPSVKDQQDSEIQPIQEETKLQAQISQPLKPEIIHQSEPTVRPPSIQSTTLLPFVTHEPQSTYLQYSTPQPQYQSTIRPKSIKTPLRHDVVIQRQEIQELFFEPSPEPPRTPRYQNQQAKVAPQYERELLQLRTQPHHQLFEQLQPLPYQHEIQDINSQQYLLEARQSLSPQKEPQQYLVQQHSHPLQLLQLLQSQQPKLQQYQQQGQVSYQAQQQQVAELAQYQRHRSEQAHQHQETQLQHRSDQAQKQQEAQPQQHRSEQAQPQQAEEQAQQQQVVEQVQQQQLAEQAQQQQITEQAQQQQIVEPAQQQQIVEQAQQQQIAEQAQQEQYQEHNFDSNNQIQISTLKPSEDTEEQTETVEIQQQSDSQSTTGKPNEQTEHSSELPSLEQPYLGPVLNPSLVPEPYAHQQQLVAQPEYSPLLGVPPYSDVQYFGKFAETLFGNHHH